MTGSKGEQAGETQARRVVVLDDDEAIVETLTEVLTMEGYDVRGFTDPIVALEALRHEQLPDVLVLDCVMPGMDGPSVIAALSAEGREVPVILVTALSDPGFCIDPSGIHATRIVNKPFDLEQLLETLAEILSARNG